MPTDRHGVAPRALARRLARAGCHEVLIEGGAALGTRWLAAGRIDRVALFVAPRLLGAPGLPWCGAFGRRRLADALAGGLTQVRRVGGDALLVAELPPAGTLRGGGG